MKITITPEKENDYEQITALLKSSVSAPTNLPNQIEKVVSHLRNSPTFLANLSIVLKLDDKVIGYALFTPIVIKDTHKSVVSLALSLVVIQTSYRKLGFASQLINYGKGEAQKLGFKSLAALGQSSYLAKFGFRPIADYKITFHNAMEGIDCVIQELSVHGLNEVHGEIIFPKEVEKHITSS